MVGRLAVVLDSALKAVLGRFGLAVVAFMDFVLFKAVHLCYF